MGGAVTSTTGEGEGVGVMLCSASSRVDNSPPGLRALGAMVGVGVGWAFLRPLLSTRMEIPPAVKTISTTTAMSILLAADMGRLSGG